MMALTVAQLESAGGRYWTKGDKQRVYFNNLVDHYDRSGMSKTAVRRLFSDLDLSKLWYDLTDNRWHWQGMMTADDAAYLIARLTKRAEASPVVTTSRYICDECGAELAQPFCPSCRDEMFIRAIA